MQVVHCRQTFLAQLPKIHSNVSKHYFEEWRKFKFSFDVVFIAKSQKKKSNATMSVAVGPAGLIPRPSRAGRLFQPISDGAYLDPFLIGQLYQTYQMELSSRFAYNIYYNIF